MKLDDKLSIEAYEENFVKGNRKVDYISDIMFATGVGLIINAIPDIQFPLGLAGAYVSFVGGSLRTLSAYSKWYYHPDNSDIRERIESGEKVSRMERWKRRK